MSKSLPGSTARSLVTGAVLITLLVTAMLPGWATHAQAATGEAPPVASVSALEVPVGSPAPPSARAETATPEPTVPLNTLILADAETLDTVARTITQAGGTLYVRYGDALFAGVEGLDSAALIGAGARAAYRGPVPTTSLAMLSGDARAAAMVWNAIAAPSDDPADANAVAVQSTARTAALVSPEPPAPARTSATYAPTPEQTSAYMVGDVAVKVLFVESTAGPETWTATEVDKVKTEITQALAWWTTVSTVPATPGGAPRPNARLTWNVSYVSPFDGPTGDRAKIQVAEEPIQGSVASASAVDSGWIHQVATAFNGLPADGTSVRQLAHDARTSGGADWGLVLYVVDSSADDDGLFDGDGLAAGAAIGGPWAVVTYDGGDLGVSNLEILIAKMVGHIFGAGDESSGCRPDEVYGYLRIAHTNCEDGNPSPAPSLMRSGEDMVAAYRAHALSKAARQQVGWRDADNSGVYDVLETLKDTFAGFETAPVCPALHLAQVPIEVVPALPQQFGSGDTPEGWSTQVWDRDAQVFVPGPRYQPVAVNRPRYVWGRVNSSDWERADPSDGEWDSQDEAYTLQLFANPGSANTVEVAILDRWEQQVYFSPEPVEVWVISPITASGNPAEDLYQSNDNGYVALYSASGMPGGWTPSVADDGYSPGGPGSTTLLADGPGSEACFSFSGTEVTLLYSQESEGTANVYVDGALHSVITYSNTGQKQAEHIIANLPFGPHTVTLVATAGVVDFDAFRLSTGFAGGVIDAGPDGDLSPAFEGFWEEEQPKITYVGDWQTVPLLAPDRPGTPNDTGRQATRPYDRVYAHFTGADTVAIYRGVFPGGGTADVYVDGERRGTMNNDSTVARVVPFYISGLDANTTHTVEVRVNPGASTFVLDAFRFLTLASSAQLYLADTPGLSVKVPFDGVQEVYGWQRQTSYLRSKETGALLTLFFKGSGVGVNVKTSSANGPIELYVDGRLKRTVNLNEEGAKDVPIVVVGLDPDVPHVLQVRHFNVNPAKPKYNEVYGYTVYYTAPVGPGVYEEANYEAGKPTSSVFVYEQQWTYKSTTTPGPSGGRFIESKHDQARAYLSFAGADTVTLYGVSKSTYGAADIYVDDKFYGTLYLKGATYSPAPYTVTGLDSSAFHTLEVRVRSEKGLSSTISIDKVELTNKPVLRPDGGVSGDGYYENDARVGGGTFGPPAIQFSGQWKQVADTRASGGSMHVSEGMSWKSYQSAPVVEAAFEVAGASSVVVYHRMYKSYGMVDVYVDGQYHSSFDSYAASPLAGSFQQTYIIGGLDPSFNHVIALKPRPAGKLKNSYKPFDIDAIRVRNGDASGAQYLEAGYYENNDPTALEGGAIGYVGTTWTHSDVSRGSGKGNRALVIFRGNAFTVYFKQTSDGGKADILVDGTLYGTYSMRSTTPTVVPFSVVNLGDGLHTAEIVVSSSYVYIDAYQVYDRTPDSGPTTYDLAPTDGRVILSGKWTVEGDALKTSEKDARAYIYATDADSLWVTSEVYSKTGSIEVRVNGALHSTIDAAWIKAQTPPNARYLVSGLGGMPGGAWIEIRNPASKTILLKGLEVFNISPTLGAGWPVEAEGTQVVHAVGTWAVKPTTPDTTKYSDGRYLESVGTLGRFYIPVQGISYLTVYRPIGSFGDANVYIDGELWGVMPNSSSKTAYQVPFSIGPIPNPLQTHVVELRPASSKKFGLDWLEGYGLPLLGPGYYEDTDVVFVGGEDPVTGLTYPNAYTGSWTQVADSGASGGFVHEASARGSRLVATFEGNVVTVYRQMWTYGRYMSVYIDGAPYPLNSKADVKANQIAHTILLPNTGPHSLELVLDSGKVRFDAIEFRTIAPATYGAYQPDSLYVAVNDSSTWQVVPSEQHSGGSYLMTDDKYASAFLFFEGEQATVYMHTGRDWGIAHIYVDGKLHGQANQYAPDPGELYVAYDVSGLERGTHTLEVRFERQKDKKARKYQINLDAFTVDGAPLPKPGDIPLPTEPGDGGGDVELPQVGCFEDANDNWQYFGPLETTWFTMFPAGASGGSVRRGAGEVGQAIFAEFTFEAEGFALLYHKNPYGGYADLYLDGVFVEQLDMYDPDPDGQWLEGALYERSGLSSGTHTLRLMFTGEGNSESEGTNIYVDRIDLPAYTPSCNP